MTLPAGLILGRARLGRAAAGDRDRLAAALRQVALPDGGLLWMRRLAVRTPLRRCSDNRPFAREVGEAIRNAASAPSSPSRAGGGAAEAWFFDDEAAVAACLISQWLRGATPAERAWWPHVTAGLLPPPWWRRAVVPDPRLFPIVVERLTGLGLGHVWIAALDEAAADESLRTLAAAYGFTLPTGDTRAGEPHVLDAPGAAGLAGLVREALLSSLPYRRRLLFCAALLARRRPSILAAPGAGYILTALAEASLVDCRLAAGRDPEGDSRAMASRKDSRPPAATFPTVPGAREAGFGSARTESRLGDEQPSPGGARPPSAAAVKLGGPVPASSAAPPLPRGSPLAPRRPARAPGGATAPDARGIATGYAGLLFVINALLALGLYGDFASPRRSALAMSPWTLLRRLGCSWLGPRFERDPLHALLIELAGGPEADCLDDLDPPAWPVPGGDMPSGLERAEAWEAWIGAFAHFLRARIAAALGLRSATAAVRELCRRPGSLLVTDERLVVRLALDTHPVALRIAGLDRDPGWVPAAGRIVEFKFE